MSNQPDNPNKRTNKSLLERTEGLLKKMKQENKEDEVIRKLEQELQRLKADIGENPLASNTNTLDWRAINKNAEKDPYFKSLQNFKKTKTNKIYPALSPEDQKRRDAYFGMHDINERLRNQTDENNNEDFEVGYNQNPNKTLNTEIGESYASDIDKNALEDQEWENFKRELISFIKENPQVLERLKRMDSILCKTADVSSNELTYHNLEEGKTISKNENDKIGLGEINYRELYDYYSMMNNDGNWEFSGLHQQQNQTSTTTKPKPIPKPVTKNNETISPNPNYSDNAILDELKKVLKEKNNWEISYEDLIIALTGSTQLRKLYDEIKNRKSNNITESKEGENNAKDWEVAKEIKTNSENYEKKERNKQAQDIINTISTFDNEDADLVIDGIIGENTRFELENQIINKYSDCTFALKEDDKWTTEKIIKDGENIDSFLTKDKKSFSKEGLKKLEKIYQYKINIAAQKILSKISSYSIKGIHKEGKNKLDGIIGPNSKEALKKILENHNEETVTITIDDKEEKITIDKNDISQFFDEDEDEDEINISKKGVLILKAIAAKEEIKGEENIPELPNKLIKKLKELEEGEGEEINNIIEQLKKHYKTLNLMKYGKYEDLKYIKAENEEDDDIIKIILDSNNSIVINFDKDIEYWFAKGEDVGVYLLDKISIREIDDALNVEE